MSEKTLEQTFTTKLSGLNAEVPSLEITKASGFENLVAIRGIGSETPENSLTTVPGVSLGVPWSSPSREWKVGRSRYDKQGLCWLLISSTGTLPLASP